MSTPNALPNENESSTDGASLIVSHLMPTCDVSLRAMICTAIPKHVLGNKQQPNLAPLHVFVWKEEKIVYIKWTFFFCKDSKICIGTPKN